MGTEFPWRWGRGTISANLDVIWGMSDQRGVDRLMTIIDCGRYPISDLVSDKGRAMAVEARRQLATTGAFHLPGFLSPAGLACCLAEAEALESSAHFSNNKLTPYYRQPDPSLPDNDPKNMAVVFSVGYVAREDIPAGSAFRALYEGNDFLDMLRAMLPGETLYRYSEPRGSLNVTVMRRGDELGWHFDACELVASILFRDAQAGGEFDYVPGVRSPDDANEAGVAAVISGDEQGAHQVCLKPGDLLLFRGRHSLHRVRHVRGDVSRLIGLMSFDNAEKAPPNRATDELMRPASST